MKAFLLLSLLLANLAASYTETTTPIQTTSASSDTTTLTQTTNASSAPTTLTQTTSASSAPTTLTQTTSASSAPTTLTQTTSASSAPTTLTQTTSAPSAPTTLTQTTSAPSAPTTLTQTTNASSAPTTLTQTTSASSAPTTLTQTTSAPSAPTTLTQTTNASSAPTTLTQTTNASPDPITPTQTTNASPDPITPTQPTNASSDPITPTQPTNTSSNPITPTQPTNASSDPITPTQPTNASSDPITPTQPTNTSSNPITPTQPTNASSDPTKPTQSPDVSSRPPVTSQSPGVHDPCESNPCRGSSSCVKLYSEHFCLCLEGYYYQNPLCVKGKTFPGEIVMTVPESLDLGDKISENYQEFHSNVSTFFKDALNKSHSGYGQTIILKASTTSSLTARSAMRTDVKTVYVSVVNMFDENTTETENSVSDAIKKALESDSNMKSYVEQDLCNYYGCKENKDSCQDALNCECKAGLTRKNPQTPFCLPLECPGICSAEDNQQCIKRSNGALECVCVSGYRNSNGNCKECPFGYSGLDCKDNFQLILTIVGTIAGVLILALLIGLIVSASSKKKRKNVEEQNLIENDFQNVHLQQTGFSNSNFSNFGGEQSIFPKVRTGAPRQTQNPYANQRNVPHPDY